MMTRTTLRQFLADGLFGILTTFLLFIIPVASVFMGFLILGSRGDPVEFLETLTVFYEPSYFAFFALYVICITFVGSGMGGRFVQNVATRQDWMTHILKVVGVSWIAGLALTLLGIGALIFFNLTDLTNALLGAVLGLAFFAQVLLPITGCLSAFGFLFVGLFAMLANPETRFYKMLLGSIASSVVGYSFGSILLVVPFING